jgi:hypothetical protein
VAARRVAGAGPLRGTALALNAEAPARLAGGGG